VVAVSFPFMNQGMQIFQLFSGGGAR
jgi:hypothetical protein